MDWDYLWWGILITFATIPMIQLAQYEISRYKKKKQQKQDQAAATGKEPEN